MFIELGHFALIIAMLLSLFSSLSCCFFEMNKRFYAPLNTICSHVAFLFTLFAFAALVRAFIVSDFSVALVANHSSYLKPLVYKITAVWGNHEGSMLLWLLVLSIFWAGIAHRNDQNEPYILNAGQIMAGIYGLFAIYTLCFSSPFERLMPVPFNGQSLNPVLQDPALAIHPPLLYIGYVGCAAVFALTLGALMERKIDKEWAVQTLPWVHAAWLPLSAGLALGGWWAYYELGWGGWWFWDPVENIALLPWLALTVLYHNLILLKVRGIGKSSSVLLGLLAFVLTIFGTFIVRSGIIDSVHTFALDPERALMILLILIIIGSIIFYQLLQNVEYLNAPPENSLAKPLSRDLFISLYFWFGLGLIFITFIGTLFPLLSESYLGHPVSVGPDFYRVTFVPIALLIVLMMGIAPYFPFALSAKPSAIFRQALFPVLACVAILLFSFRRIVEMASNSPVLAVLGIIIGLLALLLSVKRQLSLEKLSATAIAHLGMGVVVVGMVGSTLLSNSATVELSVGESHEFNNYYITLDSYENAIVDNYNSDRIKLIISDNKNRMDAITTLIPEQRWYPIAGVKTSEVDYESIALNDIYAVYQGVDATDETKHIIQIRENRFIILLWLGWLIMLLGGMIALYKRFIATKTYPKA